jgi:hypothetical protein
MIQCHRFDTIQSRRFDPLESHRFEMDSLPFLLRV